MLKKEEHLPPQEMADLVTNTLELYIEDNREDDNLDTPRLTFQSKVDGHYSHLQSLLLLYDLQHPVVEWRSWLLLASPASSSTRQLPLLC